MSNVLVIGKFMPPHKGHKAMMEFAKQFGIVHVMVDHLENETLSVNQRVNILKNDIANIQVYGLTKYMPQDPTEIYNYKQYSYKDFWDMWRSEISYHWKNFDYVVASEDYGRKLAELFDAEFIQFDPERTIFNVSATKIRNDLYTYFDYLLPTAKALFSKKICFVGAECSGKTTLAKQFADILNTQYVPEYAEGYIKKKGFFDEKDSAIFIERQIALENSLAINANRYLICDSCYLSTEIFFKSMENFNNTYLENALIENSLPFYDLFVVMEPIDYEEDGHRNQLDQNKRMEMHFQFIQKLEEMEVNFIVLNAKNNYLVKNKENIEHFLLQHIKW